MRGSQRLWGGPSPISGRVTVPSERDRREAEVGIQVCRGWGIVIAAFQTALRHDSPLLGWVAVAVLVAVFDTVVITVGVEGTREAQLRLVLELVAVAVIDVVLKAVVVRIVVQWVGVCLLLLSVRESVAVGVLTSVAHAVAIRVETMRIGMALVELVLVAQSVTVAIAANRSGGRAGRAHGDHEGTGHGYHTNERE